MTPYRAVPRIAVLCACLSPAVTLGQQVLAVPAEVETAVTGGKWKSGNATGTYRVIVMTGGFEHIVSQLQVDWIAETGNGDEPPRVVSSRMAETGSWRLLRPRIVQTSGSWRVLVEDIETHFNPAPRATWEIDLGQPGTLKARLLQR
jgi:hypothetical protein